MQKGYGRSLGLSPPWATSHVGSPSFPEFSTIRSKIKGKLPQNNSMDVSEDRLSRKRKRKKHFPVLNDFCNPLLLKPLSITGQHVVNTT